MGKISSWLLLIIVGNMTRGYALSKLWTWFIEPIFHAPHLRIPVALGVATLVGLLTIHAANDSKSETATDALIKGWVTAIIIPGLSLLFGWIYLQFV